MLPRRAVRAAAADLLRAMPALADMIGSEIEHVDFAACCRERVFAGLHREYRARYDAQALRPH